RRRLVARHARPSEAVHLHRTVGELPRGDAEWNSPLSGAMGPHVPREAHSPDQARRPAELLDARDRAAGRPRLGLLERRHVHSLAAVCRVRGCREVQVLSGIDMSRTYGQLWLEKDAWK